MPTPLGRELIHAAWRKSSYSNSQGGDCLEVGEDFPSAATWRKSSYSNGQGGACVEVAESAEGGLVPVRDSKDTSRPPLVFGAGAWRAFIAGIPSR